MTNIQRMKNDMATIDRRESEDEVLHKSRDRNDLSTQERRFEADKTTEQERTRNDELTADRREIKDGNVGGILAVSLAVVVILAIGALLIFV